MTGSRSKSRPAEERLREAAGKGFRVGGYGGVGVDGLAKAAGLTSGAFYAHFGSKADAFRIALVDGLDALRAGIEAFQAREGEGWLAAFVEFYFGERLEADLSDACALPTLTADAARSDGPTRAAYTAGLSDAAAAMARGLDGDEDRAWAALAILSGAAAMARAVDDPDLRARLLSGAKSAISAAIKARTD